MFSALILAAHIAVAGLPQGEDLAKLCIPSLRQGLADKDGSLTKPWGGSGQVQLSISQKYLANRAEQLHKADKLIREMNSTLLAVDKAQKKKERKALSQDMQRLAGEPLDTLEQTLLQALEYETKRLKMVNKALEKAQLHKNQVPNADPEVIKTLILEIDSGSVHQAVKTQISAYRSLFKGVAAFLDGELVTAMKHTELATRTAPDLAIAHQYLGSFYFLARTPKKALDEWRLALKLDPKNEALKRAIDETEEAFGD